MRPRRTFWLSVVTESHPESWRLVEAEWLRLESVKGSPNPNNLAHNIGEHVNQLEWYHSLKHCQRVAYSWSRWSRGTTDICQDQCLCCLMFVILEQTSPTVAHVLAFVRRNSGYYTLPHSSVAPKLTSGSGAQGWIGFWKTRRWHRFSSWKGKEISLPISVHDKHASPIWINCCSTDGDFDQSHQ